MQKITPALWFDGNAQEAMDFYTSIFKNSEIISVEKYPDESIDPHFKGMSGKVINGVFRLDNQEFVCIDGGPQFKFNEAISFAINCKDQAEIDYFWEKLSSNPDAEACGWCRDKFGISWQILPENMAELMNGEASVKAMMQMKKIDIEGLKSAK
jgi:predicted 3-demethylubiquinone-9 3-methyltransferase (glyoxalase superfamily)